MKYHSIVLVYIIGLVSIATVHSSNCCGKNLYVTNNKNCSDDGRLSPILLPKCDGSLRLLNNEWSFVNHYIIRNDTNGEYLDDFEGGYIVRYPNFCVGEKKYTYSGRVIPIAVICSTMRIEYTKINTKIDETDNPDYYYLEYLMLLDYFGYVSSSLLLAFTFYIYYLVIPSRQIEEDCLLNLAGCLCISYAAFFYANINTGEILPDTCITNLYAAWYFLLCTFVWYALYTYHLWKEFKCGWLEERDAILNKFKTIGYGAPALLIVLVNIHAHYNKLYTEFSFEMDCSVHEFLIEEIYMYAPITASIGTNCYFWRDLKNHIEIKAVNTTEDELNRKKVQSLLTLNQRLFFIFALPWLFYMIINGLREYFLNEFLIHLYLVMDTVIDIFPIFVAFILVMTRARVWKCIVLKYKDFQWLQKWQPSDEDGGSLYDHGSLTVSQTFPPEV